MLGAPRFERADGASVSGLGPKAISVLACLVSASTQRMGRSDLVGLIWADLSSSPAARHALRQCLLRMRIALGPAAVALGADGDSLWLEPGRWCSDLGEIRQALADDDPARLGKLSAAVEGGGFCAGLDANGGPFEHWLRQRRHEADELCAQLHARAATVLLAQGATQQAIDAAYRRLAIQPYDEGAHADLIALLMQAGRRQAAVDARNACMELFDRDLGICPDPMVQRALATAPAKSVLRQQFRPDARWQRRSGRAAAIALVLASLTSGLLMRAGPDRIAADADAPMATAEQSPDPAPQAWITAASVRQMPASGATPAVADDDLRRSIGKMLEGDRDHARLYPVGC